MDDPTIAARMQTVSVSLQRWGEDSASSPSSRQCRRAHSPRPAPDSVCSTPHSTCFCLLQSPVGVIQFYTPPPPEGTSVSLTHLILRLSLNHSPCDRNITTHLLPLSLPPCLPTPPTFVTLLRFDVSSFQLKSVGRVSVDVEIRL